MAEEARGVGGPGRVSGPGGSGRASGPGGSGRASGSSSASDSNRQDDPGDAGLARWFHDVPTWFVRQALDDATRDVYGYARDAWLPPSVAARFEAGLVLRSPAIVEMTSRFAGMRTSWRFTVLSNHAVNVGELFDDDAAHARGQFGADTGSRFLVLNVFRTEGTPNPKTQALLLHLPDDERWELVAQAFAAECQATLGSRALDPAVPDPFRPLIAVWRTRFQEALALPLPPELDDDWLTTCHDPVGIDEGGRPFPLESPIEGRLRPLGDLDFRDVAGHLVLLTGAREELGLDERGFGDRGVVSAAYPHALCWCYLDHERGLELRLLKACRITRAGGVETGSDLDGLRLRVDAGSVLSRECAPVLDRALAECAQTITELHEAHVDEDERMAPVRAVRDVDRFRSRACPDNVRAYLAGERRMKPEVTWLRTECLDASGRIMARLLAEPAQDCGVHEGDLLPLALHDTIDGTLCLALVDG